MLKVYLAGRYRWAAQIETVARKLREIPEVKVSSEWHRWVAPAWMTPEQVSTTAAKMDVEGVKGCDVLIFFRKPPARPVRLSLNELARGGRFIELGMAMAFGKKIIAFGDVDRDELCVFEVDEDIPVFSVVRDLVDQIACIAEVF